ncbi:Hypothetical protein R9X50_00280900 [Acrodontium crateriforme]|uniref:Uncharacterized protein n=1 Tax=Acrodontium crateriforme TaxID=150365 RepID=A0AAQ3R8W4_9PEZI|nr:Hypothetical protein R9X50_00280900 [Acrodontium crateriforme]
MLKTPPLQTATATIDTLCGRLQSATLLEDRRAAILGLRSFAKQYPASVAGGSLRELIAILRRDGLGLESTTSSDGRFKPSEEGGDVDTIRLVLETLLMLFNPDSNSPEASDEIELFMADEFSMRQDNITLLLSLLDPTSPFADYYSRLYSVQILSAVCAARPERLQECILSAPLGVSRLVGILDDGRDAVRNAGLLLLVDLTGGANEELKKIVAFEDVFGKIFALIHIEGGLAEAGITAQDCLSLMANLIKGSGSNQTMFRESGCVVQMVQLLQEAFPIQESEAEYVTQSREKALWGLLQLLGLFLVPGEASTAQNQTAFFRANTSQILIDLGYHDRVPMAIRILALRSASLLIACNAPLQEAFAALTVVVAGEDDSSSLLIVPHQNGTRSATPSAKGSARPSSDKPRTYIIEALLDLTLTNVQDDILLRAAACNLIQAYLTNHDRIKSHFLQRAIAGHEEREEAANVLITLLHPGSDTAALTYASCIVSELISEVPDAKVALASLKEGDESAGEDVLTSIQALGAHLHDSLQQQVDERVVAAYAGLLIVLLWDFASGVDNLLAEGSSLLQSLISATNPGSGEFVIAGLSAILLGTIYEFSTKDSPIPRKTLAPLLTQKLGRNKYLDSLALLRRQPAIRDFELEDLDESDKVLNKELVDLFTVEYSRLRRAIDKDPGVEVLPASAAEAGVDRDVLDELRKQLQGSKDALLQAQQDHSSALQQYEQDKMSATRDFQSAKAEVERIRKINESMQQSHESELQKYTANFEKERKQMRDEHQHDIATAKQESERQTQRAVRDREDYYSQKMADYERRVAELGNVHRKEQADHGNTREQLEALTAKHAEIFTSEQSLAKQVQDLTQRHAKIQREHDRLQSESTKTKPALERAEKEAEERGAEVKALAGQLEELRADLKSKDDELTAERAGFAELEKELGSAKSRLSEMEKELEASKSQIIELEKQLNDSKAFATDLEKQLTASRSTVSDLEKHMKNSQTSSSDSANQLKASSTQVAELEKELKAVQDELSVSKAALSVLRADAKKESINGKGKKDKSNSDKADKASAEKLAKAEANVKKLETDLAQAKENEKTAKEELESMLLVMGDIESKRDEYKAKIEELGGEVTDEDDDDDEDEDEDENSDDVD